MNPVNLYISTCRYVIQSNPQDPDTWMELYRYIPYLRQALSCCVCTQVFHCPMGPEYSKCYHHVCKECLGGKMRIKPACGWCNDFTAFIEKPQLKIIVKCFKKLCEYIASSAIAINLATTSNGGTSGGNQLLNIIQDAVSIKDDVNTSPTTDTPVLNLLPPILQKVDTESHNVQSNKDNAIEITNTTNNKKIKRSKKSKTRVKKIEVKEVDSVKQCSVSNNIDASQELCVKSELNVLDNCSNGIELQNMDEPSDSNNKVESCIDEMKSKISETVKAEHDYIKEFPIETCHKVVLAKPKSRRSSSYTIIDGESSNKKCKVDRSKSVSHISDSKNNNNSTNEKSKLKQNNKSGKSRNYGCRCGLATPKPGNLTCCGQRCPCYSAFKGCEECKCRGCRNPRGDPAKNPLAALRLQRQLQNVQIIQGPISQSRIENIEISETLLPVHTSCMGEADLDIVDIDI